MTALAIVPLRAASPSEVREAVRAASDAMTAPDGAVANWLELHRWLLLAPTADFWAAALLFDEVGGAGWTGWIPYRERRNSWQSSTWIAPRLRGQGLLPLLRCDQVHRAEQLADRWQLDDARFVSSIAVGNTRSLTASRGYAASAGWNGWSRVREAGRDAWVLSWPFPATPHVCFLPG